ncbi:Hypothetical protein R9X50_00219400 [Acrodontium crateriforme]|uniref:Mob1/phocein n=1 Tax=Acrodontium crateriforme TaxID=150365 RepID=A0AAQ3M3T0_9PEZI|nr:Hypothetical protein R9X50_00219400 [Acrodontium crateriforme]
MSSWMNNLRAFGRGANPTRNQSQPPSRGNTSSPSPYSPSSLGPPNIPPTPASPSLTTAMSANNNAYHDNGTKKIPLFFREEYATFIVKGNFMTLAAKPALLEEGEWLAHQIVEQNRLLGGMIKATQAEDRSTGRLLCNDQICSTMSAGPTTYTWIDTNRNPINLPAPTYIKHILTWVNGKIQDQTIFPSDSFTSAPPLPSPAQIAGDPNYWLGKSSGFPQRFETEMKNMYKQMFRCYAHLYWQHWLFFWDTGLHRELNTCFIHFVNVGRLFNLFTDKDIEPMQPLIDLWVNMGALPQIEKFEATPTAPASAA